MATSTLQLTLLMLFTNLCLASCKTVMEGSTMNLSCRAVSADNVSMTMSWMSPHGNMIRQRTKSFGVWDKRYSVEKLSSTIFKIRVSHVTFKDGGNYTCSQYGNTTMEKTVKTVTVTVLGQPKVKILRHKRAVKCTAEGNNYPPQIFWQICGIEFDVPPHDTYDNNTKKYYSENILRMRPLKEQTLCCIVRHPQLHSKNSPLKSCLKVREDFMKIPRKTRTWSSTDKPRGSTHSLKRMTTRPVTDKSTKDTLTATNMIEASPEATTLEATARTTVTSTAIRLDTMTTTSNQTTFTRSLSDKLPEPAEMWSGVTDGTWRAETGEYTSPRTPVSTGVHPNTSATHVPVTEVTDKNINRNTSQNSTELNSPQSNSEEMGKQSELPRNSGLLIFLVTCLIFSLSVVVVFLAIKLRRAHIHWKRENEDSDQSIESNKSSEQSLGQKCRGIFQIAFTKYVIEEPTVISAEPTSVAVTTGHHVRPEETCQGHAGAYEEDRAPVRETEL